MVVCIGIDGCIPPPTPITHSWSDDHSPYPLAIGCLFGSQLSPLISSEYMTRFSQCDDAVPSPP